MYTWPLIGQQRIWGHEADGAGAALQQVSRARPMVLGSGSGSSGKRAGSGATTLLSCLSSWEPDWCPSVIYSTHLSCRILMRSEGDCRAMVRIKCN